MDNVSSETLRLISRIYDGGLSADHWPVILDEMALHLNARGSALMYYDAQLPELNHSITCWSAYWRTSQGDKYFSSVTEDEPSARLLKKRQPRDIMTSENISLTEKLSIGIYAAKMWKLFGIRAVAAVQLNQTDAWYDYITFQYDSRHGPMKSEEQQQLEILLPHIAKSLEISRPMRLLEQRFQRVLEALDHYHVGVFILSAGGSCIVKNQEATRILEMNDSLSLNQSGHLKAKTDNDNAQLSKAIQETTATVQENGLTDGVLMPIARTSGKDPLLIEVVPTRNSSDDLGHLFKGAMIFAIDPAEPGKVSTKGMEALYSLTTSEASVCRHLVEGFSNPEIAEKRNVSPETVKTQVQSALRKTGTTNRSELIRLALSINLPVDKA